MVGATLFCYVAPKAGTAFKFSESNKPRGPVELSEAAQRTSARMLRFVEHHSRPPEVACRLLVSATESASVLQAEERAEPSVFVQGCCTIVSEG